MKILTALLGFLISFNSLAHTVRYYAGAPLEIITIGHPTLTMVAEEVPHSDIKTDDFQKLIKRMTKTMKKAKGVGIAAPQVNVSRRLFIIKPTPFKKAEAIINPTIDYSEERGTFSSREGCLSIPGRVFTVPRYKQINVQYYDRKGHYKTETVKGFRATVFQHEYDHLNGVMISDFFQLEELEGINHGQVPLM